MAILRSVVDVNNGNTGWTNSDVLDALETVFANLGFHGGSQMSGVPQAVLSPGNRTFSQPDYFDNIWNGGRDENFRHGQGGQFGTGLTTKSRYFYVTNNGTTAYRVLEEFRFNGNTQVNITNDTIYDDRHGLETGDAIHYAPGVTSPDSNYVIGGLSADTIYYAIKVDNYNFKVAANETDANNGIAIDLTAVATTSGYYFRRADNVAYDNYNIVADLGDQLYFIVNDQSGGEFSLCTNTDTYNVNRLLSNNAYNNNYGYMTLYTAKSSGGTGTVRWDTRDWKQSEDVPNYAPQQPHPAWGNIGVWGAYGLTNYIYVSDTNPDMKGTITLRPRLHNRGGAEPTWHKYTVPANGGRSALTIRIYFEAFSYGGVGWIKGMTVESLSTGWTDADTFTIPGDYIEGGVSPTNDLRFGINQNESSTNAYDGTYSLAITNLGGGSSFFQKHDNGYYAILKIVNDANKTYGTTYYTFNMVDNSYFNMCGGNDFEWANFRGTSHTNTSQSAADPGRFRGLQGLDYQYSYNYLSRTVDNDWNRIQFATTSTPTAYPMSIRVYRAQAPQDTNFAIIQFTQTINGNIVPYGTISLHKGQTFGSSVFDLDHVYLDSYTEYTTTTRGIELRYRWPGYTYYSLGQEERDSNLRNAKIRAASYGWIRDPNQTYDYMDNIYACNIDTDNLYDGREILTYYRNSNYDGYGGSYVDPAADYFKPIKGIPINNCIVPCPYYLPDDFIMLQVSTTPGLTTFRPGDTVTISPSEVYEVILAGYQTSQNGLDNVNNNSSMGMLFLARTT